MRKTWHEKYRTRPKPIIEITRRRFSDIPRGVRVVISTPAEIEREVRKIPVGVELTTAELRERIAKKHRVPFACPITTGIFLRIASEVAIEDLQAGKGIKDIMPFWRVVTPKSTIGKKLACGQDFIMQMRKKEHLSV